MTAKEKREMEDMLYRRTTPRWLLPGSGVSVTVNLNPAVLATYQEILSEDGWTVEEGIERLVNTLVETYQKRKGDGQ